MLQCRDCPFHGSLLRKFKRTAMLIDIPQLVIQLNEPLRDCPALLGRVLAYVEPTPISAAPPCVWR